MTNIEQLDKWCDGESIHNGETSDEGICCPDFSCCTPEIVTPIEIRKRFRKAFVDGDEDTINKMLMMFMGGMLSVAGLSAEVILAGEKHDEPS